MLPSILLFWDENILNEFWFPSILGTVIRFSELLVLKIFIIPVVVSVDNALETFRPVGWDVAGLVVTGCAH